MPSYTVNRHTHPFKLTYDLYEPTNKSAAEITNLVMIVGGQGSSRTLYKPLAKRLIQRGPLRVLLFDRRNQHESDLCFEASRSLLEEEAEDTHELLHHLNLSPAVVFGSSSGGRLAALLALRHPQDLRSLIMAPPTGNGNPQSAPWLAKTYYGRYIQPVLKGGMKALLDVENSMYAHRSVEELEAHCPEDFASCMRSAVQHMERDLQGHSVIGITRSELGSIHIPALVMHDGDSQDTLHTVEDAAMCASALPMCHFPVVRVPVLGDRNGQRVELSILEFVASLRHEHSRL